MVDRKLRPCMNDSSSISATNTTQQGR